VTMRVAEALARAMIGKPGSRFTIPTPALIVDEAALDANIAKMAGRLGGRAVLRPHRYDAFHVVRGDRLVAIVPIDAARASQ